MITMITKNQLKHFKDASVLIHDNCVDLNIIAMNLYIPCFMDNMVKDMRFLLFEENPSPQYVSYNLLFPLYSGGAIDITPRRKIVFITHLEKQIESFRRPISKGYVMYSHNIGVTENQSSILIEYPSIEHSYEYVSDYLFDLNSAMQEWKKCSQ